MNDTIAAVATPHGTGGISVIRISGENALNVADKIFKPLSSDKKPSECEGYTCVYGVYTDSENKRIDDGIVTVFRAPKSYTGENMAEASCHGGIYVTEKLLGRIYQCGAVPAEAGEFTKRAFLNGKMSLTQAESVMDIISADGESYYRCAENLREGALFKKIKEISDRTVHILGDISAWVDYPEDDIPAADGSVIKSSLIEIIESINVIRDGYNSGRIIREGIDTVICGKPNVGKSTLMNLLAGCERSIVTSAAGTTRDIIEESVRLGDIVLKLSDTAGIRSADDEAEKIGIMFAEKKINSADLILAVFDSSKELDNDDMRLIEKCRGKKNAVAVINKSDKEKIIDDNQIISIFENSIYISAKEESSAEKIKSIIEKIYPACSSDNFIMANERQKNCLDKAEKCFKEAVSAIDLGVTLDAVEVIIEDGEKYLLELTGERVSDAVVNEVFSRFCVGK